MFFGYPAEHGGAVHVHQQGDGHHGKGPPGESDFRFIVKQAVYGLPDNPSASDQEQGPVSARAERFSIFSCP